MYQSTLANQKCSNPPNSLKTRYTKKYSKVVKNLKTTTLSRFFRVMDREAMAIQHMRENMHMSVNHIAKVLGRSTQTVHRFTSWYNETRAMGGLPTIDNRNHSPKTRTLGVMNFMSNLMDMRIRVGLFLKGLVDSMAEALALKPGTVSLFFEESGESENTLTGEADEPP